MKGNKGSLKSMKIRLLSGLSPRCKIISLPLSVKKTGILPSASRFFWNKTVQRMRSPRRAIAGPDMTNDIHTISYTNCHVEIFNKNINFPEIKFQWSLKTLWLICCQFPFWIFTSFCLLLLLGSSSVEEKTAHEIGNFGEIFVESEASHIGSAVTKKDVLQFSCWPVIEFYSMLKSTGYLAPLAPMVIPGSQYSNFTFNMFIVVIYFWARVSTNKDWFCYCFVWCSVNRFSDCSGSE